MSEEPSPANWLAVYTDKNGSICLDGEDAPDVESFKQQFHARNPGAELLGIFRRVE